MIPRPIEIVGGGLAGLALGLALRRTGVPVTIHEAGSYPRHRVCGEFIAGLSAVTIRRLQLETILAGAVRHRRVAWFLAGRPAGVHTLPGTAFGLSRHTLDHRLAAAFVAAGGNLRERSRISGDEPRSGRVFAAGRRADSTSGWLGLKIHALNLPLARGLELHLGPDAYVGLARVEGPRVNVCGLFRRRPLAGPGAVLLGRYLAACGLESLATRLQQARVDHDSFSAVAALSFAPPRPVAGRVQLGDAWAMIPPFTGNGMAMALQSAETALPHLLGYARGEADWPETAAAVSRALQRRFRVRLAAARLLHPHLLQHRGQRWLSALARSRLLPFRPLYGLLH